MSARDKNIKAKATTSNGSVVGKRVLNGATTQTKFGWGRNEEGKLLLPNGLKVVLTSGWMVGLIAGEKELIYEHNERVAAEQEREVFNKQDEDAKHFTPAQRGAAAARKISNQLINELEAHAFIPLGVNDQKKLASRKSKMSIFMDMIKLHKSLVEHVELIAKDNNEVVNPKATGVLNMNDIKKKMNEVKKANGAKED